MSRENQYCKSKIKLLFSLWIMLELCSFGYAAWPPDIARDFDKDPLWGKETNGLKVGLMLQYAPDPNRTLVGFSPALYNSSISNCLPGGLNHLWLWLPPFDSRYQMKLTDTNGMEVAKTPKGKALGKPIDKPLRLSRGGFNYQAGYTARILTLTNREVTPSDSFVLEDYFTITNAGKYHLEFEMVVVWPTQKNSTNAVHLPPVDAEIEIKNP